MRLINPTLRPEPQLIPPRERRIDALLSASLITCEPADTAARIRYGLDVGGCALWVREGAALRLVGAAGVQGSTDLLAVACAAADARTPVRLPDGRSCVAVPLVSSGEMVGLLGLVTDDRRRLGDDDLADATALCARLGAEAAWRATHLRLLAEQERLRETSMIDTLTGAWTRAAFERTVFIELAAARRRGEALTLVAFDIVGLDRINDVYGHRAGDAALTHVASVLRANIRISDEMGRIGGDELGVLLLGSSEEISVIVVEKLVRRVAESRLRFEGRELQIQVRAGLTGCMHDERSGDAAFGRALWAMTNATESPTGVALVPAGQGQVSEVDGDEPSLADAPAGGMDGATIGGMYRVIHEISRGATGVVYRGEDLSLGRPVAIKVLRSDLSHDPALVERFRVEAATLASLRHPNLVEVYTAGVQGTDAYFVMELVEGKALTDVLEEAALAGEWLDAEAVAEMVREVADALDAMHRVGLIHRDVKPDNVVLDRVNHRAVLVDVGTAKRHDERQHGAGTPGYAAPESFAGEEETAATDVYELAATAYAMLTGRLPYGAGDALAVLARQLDGPPEPPTSYRPDLGAGVDAVLLKGLSVEPGTRFSTPGGLAVALQAAVRRCSAALEPQPEAAQRRFGTLTPMQAGRTVHPSSEGDSARQVSPGPSQVPVARPPTPVVPAAVAVPVAAAAPPVASPELGSIRGATFRVAAKVLGLRVGEWWLRKVAEHDLTLGQLLRPTLAPMSWQPTSALTDLLTRPEIGVEPYELARTIGLGLVATTFAQIWGADPSEVTPEEALAAAPSYWHRYFTSGDVAVLSTQAEHAILLVSGPPNDPVMRGLIAGCLARIAELTGVDDVSVESSAEGEGIWRFVVRWRLDELDLDESIEMPLDSIGLDHSMDELQLDVG